MSDSDRWEAAQALRKTRKKRDKKNNRVLGPAEDAIFAEMGERNSQRDTKHLHPSDISKGNWCLRQTYYKMTDTTPTNPETFTLRKINLFAEGHFTHEKWQEWLRRAGILWGNWLCQWCHHKWEALSPSHCPVCYEGPPKYAEVDIYDAEYHIIGQADGWLKDDMGDAILEIKSLGVGTLMFEAPTLFQAFRDGHLDLDEVWKRIKRPLATHNRQVQLYMYFLGVHKAVVLYEWKATQEVKEFHIELDMDVVNPMLTGALAVLDSLKDNTVPLRPQAATDRSSEVCTYCQFKDECWGES
jgi:rubrerythrin